VSEGKIKLAERPPTYCSSCFGQQPQARHVDFGAYWDGPVIEPRNTENATEQVQIDDLVICEDCLIRAASLLGLVNAPDLTAELKAAKGSVRHLQIRNNNLARAARRLNDTLTILLDQRRASADNVADAERAQRKATREIEQGTDQEAEVALAG
jgi:hypothetical protein